ncbi:flagellar motor switch phosphatase FliY [Heyndrickxia ginsengihumi]|uniref:flagellar motor switch phosphatase FliY n=1 Tax=Heyndrickxia ginsengihumi TaxID=363870 RepID=UPI000470B70A|nr:flagellar motor switch phosphatase FliY [Heyndrickxia ginsengihumi]MBE6182763.1 flagellar motor switch phosphatase FliY [Bacillus sp. (in: firmicutes)]
MIMSDMLSQEEIDALLNGTASTENSEQTEHKPQVEDFLTSMERDTLGEIGNISFGSSATALSTLLSQKVEITTPEVGIIERQRLKDEFPHPYVAIQVKYTEGFSGTNVLVIKQSDAAIIADLMLGGTGENPEQELGDIHLSAVQEAMNQMMGSAATSMSTVFSKRIDISPPNVSLLNIMEGEGTENLPEQDLLVKVSFRLMIGNLIDSKIMQIVPLTFAKSLVSELINENASSENSVQETAAAQEATLVQETKVEAEQQTQTQQAQNVQPAVFTNFETASPQLEMKNLDMLLDIPLQVTVELGRTTKTVKEILEMGPGSIIELDKLAGEPVDILVNNQLIAIGEVVVIDENFGVRVTDIVSKKDRLKKLN